MPTHDARHLRSSQQPCRRSRTCSLLYSPPWQATFQQQMLTFQQQVLAQLTEQNRRLLAGQGQGLPEGG